MRTTWWTCLAFLVLAPVLGVADEPTALDVVVPPESVTTESVTTDESVIGCDPALCHASCGLLGNLLSLLHPSDTCFCDAISPMTNPVFFEDPRTLTEIRFIFIQHAVPTAVGGGDLRVVAAQVRAALTERLSIVAAKDGFIFSSHPLINDGWADVAVGLKYNLLVDTSRQRLVSAGVSYELPSGSRQAFQGNGDGEFHVYLTGLQTIGCAHWISGTGFRLPTDGAEESQSWYWSNHLDVPLTSALPLYLFGEANWYHWLRSGNNGIAGVEGGDLFNFGSTGVAGNDIVTGAVGVKYKPHCGLELGVAWETPLSGREDVMDNRLTVDLIVRY